MQSKNFLTLVSKILLAMVVTVKAQAADWSIVILGGLDEEEIASYSDPVIEKILNSELPSNVEVIMQVDSHGNQNDARYIKRAGFQVQKQPMREMDSANVNNFKSFLRWSKKNIQSQNVIFILMAHSWGWKGLLQDFGIPSQPSKNTMMPVREFSGAMQEVGFRPAVFLVDACVMGTVESVDYLIQTTDYLAVSQRETPYAGFPYVDLFKMLSNKSLQAIDAARAIPGMHASAFARGGKQVQAEGEYFFTSSVVVDSNNWESFRGQFKKLVAQLKKAKFYDLLKSDPTWKDRFVDMDSNIDLVEFLLQIPRITTDPKTTAMADQMLKQIAYPQELIDFNNQMVTLNPEQGQSFEILIQADELMKPGTEDDPGLPVLEKLKKNFKEINQDLNLGVEIEFSLQETAGQRVLRLSGNLNQTFQFRPWLQGARWVEIKTLNQGQLHTEKLIRKQDFVSVESFPKTSIYLAEAHTQGSPFVHGIGITLKPEMDDSEERGEDPILKLKGPEFYKSLSWNKLTGWADLIFFGR